ncbi:uncharacterized protein EDB91DRAFT_1142494, partial [Suillus paluster]|uniref:uncharacterized protein n=1 Tax=Suillus paluster TaxID=48578 RepID=UPI001B873EFA
MFACIVFQVFHHVFLVMSTSSDLGDGPPLDWMVVCNTCGDELEWFICCSDENENQGRWMVKCTKPDGGKNTHSKTMKRCQLFRFAYHRKDSPSSSPKATDSRHCKSPPRKLRPKVKCFIVGYSSHQ